MKQSASIYRICPIDDRIDIGVRAESARMPEVERVRSRRVFRVVSTGRQRPWVGVESEGRNVRLECRNLSATPLPARRGG